MAKVLGIDFAPICVPLHRRLQTFAVLISVIIFLIGGVACIILCIYTLFTPYYFLTLLYLTWYLFDRLTPRRGGRRFHWLRTWTLWKYACNFFPMKLIKTTEIPSDKNYIFVYHPHGIIGAGSFLHFGTEGSDFSEKFPGITPRLLVLNGQLDFPLYRDFLMSVGLCGVSKDSVNYLLTECGTGNGLCILVGGALEALEAKPGTNTLFLKSRKGFVKMAIKNGTSLVPVFSFGENDLYVQAPNLEGSFLKRAQLFLCHYMGISLPVFTGRGLFNYTFGILPRRRPVNTVVGAPMEVEKKVAPSIDDVNGVHQQYMKCLVELFEANKEKYGLGRDQHLAFI